MSKCCWIYLVYKSKVLNKYIVGFTEKSEIFNSFLAEKSVLTLQLTFLTEKSLANCHFLKNNILQIIRNPGYDQHSYVKTLWWLDLPTPRDEKKPMLPFFIKQAINKLSKNFGPISLLPVCGKMFKRFLYDNLFNFFLIIVYFLQINLDSGRKILATINFFQLILKS